VQWPFMMHGPIMPIAARRARVASERAAPPPKREPAQLHARAFATRKPAVWEAVPGTSQHGLAPNGRGLPLVQRPFKAHRPTTPIAALHVRVARARAAPPAKRQPAQRRLRVCQIKSAVWEASSGTSHHAFEANERGLFLVHWPSMVHELTTTIVARRARVASVRAALIHEQVLWHLVSAPPCALAQPKKIISRSDLGRLTGCLPQLTGVRRCVDTVSYVFSPLTLPHFR
jgi:hypothetical protein